MYNKINRFVRWGLYYCKYESDSELWIPPTFTRKVDFSTSTIAVRSGWDLVPRHLISIPSSDAGENQIAPRPPQGGNLRKYVSVLAATALKAVPSTVPFFDVCALTAKTQNLPPFTLMFFVCQLPQHQALYLYRIPSPSNAFLSYIRQYRPHMSHSSSDGVFRHEMGSWKTYLTIAIFANTLLLQRLCTIHPVKPSAKHVQGVYHSLLKWTNDSRIASSTPVEIGLHTIPLIRAHVFLFNDLLSHYMAEQKSW